MSGYILCKKSCMILALYSVELSTVSAIGENCEQ